TALVVLVLSGAVLWFARTIGAPVLLWTVWAIAALAIAVLFTLGVRAFFAIERVHEVKEIDFGVGDMRDERVAPVPASYRESALQVVVIRGSRPAARALSRRMLILDGIALSVLIAGFMPIHYVTAPASPVYQQNVMQLPSHVRCVNGKPLEDAP